MLEISAASSKAELEDQSMPRENRKEEKTVVEFVLPRFFDKINEENGLTQKK